MNDGSVLGGRAAKHRGGEPRQAIHQAPRRAAGRVAVPIMLGALGVALLLVPACARKDPSTQPGRGARPAAPVLTAVVAAEDVPVEVHAIGHVQPYSLVSVRSQITGPLMQVHIQEGQEVKAGDLLFSLDPRPWESALNQARANLKRDEAQMLSARLEFLRTSNLFESKIASQQDFDTAEASYRALQGTTLADSAAISNAQISLGYTTIRSSLDGRTGNLSVKAGNIVKSPDDVLLTITQVRPIYVAFSVPEQHLPAIRRESQGRALPVVAVVPSETNQPARGELTFINNMVDTATGTISLKGTFANADNVLWPGQFVRVSLTLSNLVQATVVPSQTVQTGQSGDFVFVVKGDETVETRPVTTGIATGGKTVIAAGLTPGETVVTDGQLRLVPGAKVSVKSPPTADAPTNMAKAKP